MSNEFMRTFGLTSDTKKKDLELKSSDYPFRNSTPGTQINKFKETTQKNASYWLETAKMLGIRIPSKAQQTTAYVCGGINEALGLTKRAANIILGGEKLQDVHKEIFTNRAKTQGYEDSGKKDDKAKNHQDNVKAWMKELKSRQN